MTDNYLDGVAEGAILAGVLAPLVVSLWTLAELLITRRTTKDAA